MVLLLAAQPALAGTYDSLGGALGWFLLQIAKLFADLTVTLIQILLAVVQYNDFIEADAVELGWVVMRDVMNMFFIVMLLLMAFGTVFRMDNYHYKHHLGKLLIMAVLVNFSKTITGFMIDVSQVVMLTFVNGFAQAAAGNFVQGLHLDKMFQFTQNPDQSVSGWTLFSAALLGLISVVVTTVVIGVFIVVFILRIVALWFLTIISPLAYVLNVFPGRSQEYASMWWDNFVKYASAGPILAFFLWLSLAVMQMSQGGNTSQSFVTPAEGEGGFSLANSVSASITEISSSPVLLSFIINIILLVGALFMTQKLGVAGGKLAGAAIARMQKVGTGIVKAPFKGAWKATKAAATRVNEKVVSATGGKLSLDYRDYVNSYKAVRAEKRKERYRGFEGRSQKYFREFGISPTGIGKAVLGAPFRYVTEKKQIRDSEKRKKLIEERDRPNKAAEKREQLKAEENQLSGQRSSLEQEREALQLDSQRNPQNMTANTNRINEIDNQLKDVGNKLIKNNNFQAMTDADLEKQVNVEIQADINKLNKEIQDLNPVVNLTPTMDSDQIIDFHKKQLDKSDTDLVKQDTDLNKEKATLQNRLLLTKDKDEANKIKGQIDNINEQQTEINAKRVGIQQEKTTLDGIGDIFIRTKEASRLQDIYKSKQQNLEGQEKNLTEKFKTRDLSGIERRIIDDEINSLEQTMKKRKEARYYPKDSGDYYIERERRKSVVEEKQKITSKNAEELIAGHEAAVRGRNEYQAIAYAQKLTEDGNLNELMNHYGKIGVLSETQGNSNFEGLNEYRKKILQDILHLDEQTALRYQSDLSYGAEGVGQWAASRSVGFNVDTGKFYELDEKEHTAAALAEILKMDPQRIGTSLNRLAYGGESVQSDGTLKFNIDTLGKAIAMATGTAIQSQMNRFQINAATNLTQPHVLEQLKELVNQGRLPQGYIEGLLKRMTSSQEKTVAQIINYLLSLGR